MMRTRLEEEAEVENDNNNKENARKQNKEGATRQHREDAGNDERQAARLILTEEAGKKPQHHPRRRNEADGNGEANGNGGEEVYHEDAQCLYPCPPYFCDDTFIDVPDEFYTADCLFDTWVEDSVTQSSGVRNTVFENKEKAETGPNTEGKCEGSNSRRKVNRKATLNAERRDAEEGSHEAFDTCAVLTAGTTGTTDKKTTVSTTSPHILTWDQEQQGAAGHLHLQEQQQTQKELKQRRDDDDDVQNSVIEEEPGQSQPCAVKEQSHRLHVRNTNKSEKKAEERLKLQEQRTAERKKRKLQRENESEGKRKAQQQVQQIRVYCAGVEAALVLALQKLLETPPFMCLKNAPVIFYEIAREQRQQNTREHPKTLFCTARTTPSSDALQDDRCPQDMDSCCSSLGEEFAVVTALSRLCPAALCIVRMPSPIEGYFQQLQLKMLQRQHMPIHQNDLAQQQVVVQPYNSTPAQTVVNGCLQDIHEPTSQLPCASSSSSDTDRRSRHCGTGTQGLGIQSRNEKINSILELYKHFLVLPLFTASIWFHSTETRAQWNSSVSCVHHVCRSSSTTQFAAKERHDDHTLADAECSVCSLTCPGDAGYPSGNGHAAGKKPLCSQSSSTSGCRCRSTCQGERMKTGRLDVDNERLSVFLPQELNALFTELRGAGRVVCIFQGVRGLLAVPQPQIDDDTDGETSYTDSACYSLARLSQDGCIDNLNASSHCEPAFNGVLCPRTSSFSSEDSGALRGSRNGCLSPAHQYESFSVVPQDAERDDTDIPRCSTGNTSGGTATQGQCALSPCGLQDRVAGSGRGAGNKHTGNRSLNFDAGGASLRANSGFHSNARSIRSLGALDETIASLVVDCGVDCVEPPDATSTADYILTAIKHMRAAQKTNGEQHMRIKKSKTVTAASEATLAEVAQAATAAMLDSNLLQEPHASKGLERDLSDRSLSVMAAAAEPCDTHTANFHAPSEAASTDAAQSGDSHGNVKMLKLLRPPVGVTRQKRCNDISNRYEDVFSFACQLWGKQLVQIPTVTEKVAAAVMRQYKTPAALLQRIRAARGDNTRRTAILPLKEKAASAAEAQGGSGHSLRVAGETVHGKPASDRPHADQGIIAKDKHNTLESGKTRQWVDGIASELAAIALDAYSATSSPTRSVEAGKDIAEAADDAYPWRATGKAAKIGVARAKKMCLFFSDTAAGIL